MQDELVNVKTIGIDMLSIYLWPVLTIIYYFYGMQHSNRRDDLILALAMVSWHTSSILMGYQKKYCCCYVAFNVAT